MPYNTPTTILAAATFGSTNVPPGLNIFSPLSDNATSTISQGSNVNIW